MPRLVAIFGDDIGTVHELPEGRVTIGRSSECGIQLRSGPVSRTHAALSRTGNQVEIEDLDSKNGTLVNGDQVLSRVLEAGDEIQIGDSLLAYDPPYAVAPSDAGDATIFLASGECALETVEISESARRLEKLQAEDGDNDPGDSARLAGLYQIARLAAGNLSPDTLLQRTVERLIGLVQADRVAAFREREGRLVPVIAFGAMARKRGEEGVSEQLPTQPNIDLDEVRAGGNRDTGTLRAQPIPVVVAQAVLDRVREIGASVFAGDVGADARFTGSATLIGQSVTTLMAAPIMHQGKLEGILYADRTRLGDPFGPDDVMLLTAVADAIGASLQVATRFELAQRENKALRERLREGDGPPFIGTSLQVGVLLRDVNKVAATDSTVLIRGETGTGKEVIARRIHASSPRAEGPFVVVNCACLSETLLESDLFGHEKGAFTGADQSKLGKLERANGGTLFLDEIGELTASTQARLLRVLEEKRAERVGGTKQISLDVRLIAATNRDLEEAVGEGTFRQDLYYRIAVVPLYLPPLRERPDDIRPLAEFFLEEFTTQLGPRVTLLMPDAWAALEAYRWPGNVRELRNSIERMVVLANVPEVRLEHLPPEIRNAGRITGAIPSKAVGTITVPGPNVPDGLNMARAVVQLEQAYIQAALERAEGKKIRAAELLGISRPTLDKKLRELDIDWQRGNTPPG